MNKRQHTDHSLLIFVFALFVFSSPLNIWWSASALPWYAMFIPWVVIVLLMAWNQSRQKHGRNDGN
jgi:hypothetical protein